MESGRGHWIAFVSLAVLILGTAVTAALWVSSQNQSIRDDQAKTAATIMMQLAKDEERITRTETRIDSMQADILRDYAETQTFQSETKAGLTAISNQLTDLRLERNGHR
jgi:hypothetical protein